MKLSAGPALGLERDGFSQFKGLLTPRAHGDAKRKCLRIMPYIVALKKLAAALSPARVEQSGQAAQEAVQVRLQAIAHTSTSSYYRMWRV
jgi:hypothetical protein